MLRSTPPCHVTAKEQSTCPGPSDQHMHRLHGRCPPACIHRLRTSDIEMRIGFNEMRFSITCSDLTLNRGFCNPFNPFSPSIADVLTETTCMTRLCGRSACNGVGVVIDQFHARLVVNLTAKFKQMHQEFAPWFFAPTCPPCLPWE